MTMLAFAEWMPDQPDLADATNIAVNVMPKTAQSYGPMFAMAAYSNALPSRCIGAIGIEDAAQTVSFFAGTATGLFRMDGADTLWADYTRTTGLYATAEGDFWRFAQFKDLLLATNYGSQIQFYTLGGSSAHFANLSAAAPQAKHIAVAKNFVIVGNTTDPVGGINPARLWWSANGDPTNWPIPGSALAQQTQSDYSDVVGPQGDITGLVAQLAGCDCAVFFDRGVHRMLYVGPPDIFDIFPAQNVRGTNVSNAIIPLGALVYYWSEDGFYVFDGNTSSPIGANKVDRWFDDNLNKQYKFNVVGAPDVVNKAIIWAFPDKASTTGTPNMMLIYRWDIQRWASAHLSLEWLCRLLTFGVTMDTMAAAGWPNLDTVPYSLDSAVWEGGATTLGMVDNQHRLAFFTGNSLRAQLATKVGQLVPNRRAFVQSVRPLVDGGEPTVALSARVNYMDQEAFGADVPPNPVGECPFGSDGRYHRARVTIPAGTTWTQAVGVDVTAIQAGSV